MSNRYCLFPCDDIDYFLNFIGITLDESAYFFNRLIRIFREDV